MRFFETMSGELVDAQGCAHHVAFDLRCSSRRVSAIVGNGRLRLSGTVRAGPWGEGAACHGTLCIQPWRRRLDYELQFLDPEGSRLRLVGRKSVELRHPLRSMTVLATQLSSDEDGLLAEGELHFDLNDVPAFVASFSLDAALRASNESIEEPRLELDEREHATLRALAEVLLVAGQRVPAPSALTLDEAVAILAHSPPHVVALYRGGLRMLDALSRSRAFVELSLEERHDVVERLATRSAAGSGAVLGLAMPLKAAHFARRDYLDALGMPTYDNPVAEPEPRWLENVLRPEDLGEQQLLECDVVVIGTGAGGGAVAATLAEAGLGVLMVEEGRYHRRPSFAGSPQTRLSRFWRDAGMCMTVGNLPLMVPVGKMVGGSTAINSGTCFRTPAAVLKEWRAEGLPEDFEEARFGRWLDRVERELQVEEASEPWLGRIAAVVGRGAEALGARHGPLRRNAPGCDGQGLCVVGCPTDAKRSSNVSWVPRALRAGAGLATGLPVTRVLMNGRRAVGVVARGQDRFGAPRRLEVRARAVVVACGALHTPTLLMRNGVRLPMLGRGLSVHPALGAYALFDHDMGEPWRAIPQSTYVDGLVDPRVRFEGFYAPPQIAASSMPMRGAELTRWMDAWDRVGQFGFMVRDRGVGSVRTGPRGRPFIRYDVRPDVLDLFTRGAAVLAELMLLGGAREVATCIEGVGSVRSVAEARAIPSLAPAARHFRAMAFHPLGSCRMAASSAGGVVDFEHRVFGTEGLYVMDGSSVPSSLGVNPQITIMAMALRGADALAASL